MMSASSIPVTIIGGYLGAGKTTLINRLLSGPLDRTVGVLINDFGAINVDAELIAAHDGQTLTLTNGCVCCSIADDFGTALERLRDATVDHVLVEASGAAVPSKVADIAETWPGYRLAGTRVLVDATDWRRQLNDKYIGHLVRAQLRGAGLRLVTKLDLSDQPDRELGAIQHEFGRAEPSVRGRVDAAVIFGDDRARPPAGDASSVEPALTSTVFESTATLPHQPLLDALSNLANHLERVKGWVQTERGPFVVQLAAGRVTLTPASETHDPANQLVLIGTKNQHETVHLASSGLIQPAVRPAI
jgi:G3E family GTPase